MYPPISLDDWTLDDLVDRIAEVRQLYVDTLENWPIGKVPDAGVYAEKVPAKKAPAKKAPAKKAPAKKAPAKKVAAKKAPAKKAQATTEHPEVKGRR